ncbi:hypothetical protein K2X05_07310 [bacterium]|nr:hypothetical protein [bacterium]
MPNFVLILNFIFFLFAEEDLNTKKWRTHTTVQENGQTVLTNNPQKQQTVSVSDAQFGFSFQRQSDEMGICHLRLKVVCDYGFEFQKALKNADIVVEIDNKLLKAKTDLDGVMDSSFNCLSKIRDMDASLNVKKHQQKFVLKDSPGVIKIPEKICR